MSSIIIRNVQLNDSIVNIKIQDKHFTEITQDIIPIDHAVNTQTIDAHGRFAILPGFYNAHTHIAMTLLRGYADDLALMDWLTNYIWPIEAKLTPEITYAGVRLGMLEMIRSGTVFFNDMYWCAKQTILAAEKMGMRACVGMLCKSEDNLKNFGHLLDNDWIYEHRSGFSDLIQLAKTPHAIYSTSEEHFRISVQEAKDNKIFLHTHLAETQGEFDDCMKLRGITPTQYLDKLGMLTPDTILAHGVFLTNDDVKLIAERGSIIAHNPISNMKLASGHFRYELENGDIPFRWALGTDGASSNNALSMLTEMKTASLRAKDLTMSPTAMPADLIFKAATQYGAEAFHINAGLIETGKLADCILVDLNNPALVPGYHLVHDIVYAADSSCIDTVICNGRILMQHRHIPEEDEIISEARQAVRMLLKRAGK